MGNAKDLNRFLIAQKTDYDSALAEIRSGRKRTHWMWYIFPQVQGLGFSETSRFYAIRDRAEAEQYLKHPELSARLIEICNELLKVPGNNASQIFGSPDDMKLKSSMTLFNSLPGADPVFQQVLQKFFQGKPDVRTMQIIGQMD